MAYICLVAGLLYFGTEYAEPTDSVVAPIAMVSLFTLSAAVMGYIFGYQPAQLYFDNKKKQAVNLFIQTVAVFGAITAVVFVLLFTGII